MKYLSQIKVLARAALARGRDLLLPPMCIHCAAGGAEHGVLCASCWARVHFIEPPCCRILGIPFSFDPGEDAVSPRALAEPPPFARARSRAVYGDVVRSLVSGLKFADRCDLAPWLARLMAHAGAELIADCAVCVPVPLHWRRQRRRRYNQAAELARHLAKLTSLRYEPLALIRRRSTRPQIGLSAGERIRNMQGVFAVRPTHWQSVAGTRVLLVDDVLTTGATVSACSRALLRAGASAVDVLTFATVLD